MDKEMSTCTGERNGMVCKIRGLCKRYSELEFKKYGSTIMMPSSARTGKCPKYIYNNEPLF